MCYQIRVQKHLDGASAERFDGLAITQEAEGDTLLEGDLADQAARHGPLQRLGSLGLPILGVRRLDRAPDRE